MKKLAVTDLDRLMLRLGLGVYAVATVLSLFVLWANAGTGMVFSWLTLKYAGLLALGALPLVLPAGQRVYMFVFAGLLAVLTLSDSLTYSRDQVRELGNRVERALGEKLEDLQKDYGKAEEEAERDRLRKLVAAIDDQPVLKENDKDRNERAKKDLEEKLKKATEVLEKARKSLRTSEVLDVAELGLEKDRYREEGISDQNCRDLASGKTLEFFLLAGAFLMLVGTLLAPKS